VRVGEVVAAGCRYDRPPFAWLLVTAIDDVSIGELDEGDAAREGLGNDVQGLRDAIGELYATASLVRVCWELVDEMSEPVSARAASTSVASPT
jgi:hypothetical protein